ncbi:MAG: DinB family protein [Treponema sp.]|nr:DinB family protein [Treponema sp.]
MTNTNTVSLFSRYNEKANEGLCKVVSTLTDEEWNREFQGFFKTVRSICSHNYTVDIMYCNRFKNFRAFKALEDPFFGESYDFRTVYFEDKNEYLAKRPVLDKLMNDFIAEVTEEDLAGVVKFEGRNGTVERNFGAWLLQLFSHSAHHRGMVSVYLELLGKENDFNSLTQALT